MQVKYVCTGLQLGFWCEDLALFFLDPEKKMNMLKCSGVDVQMPFFFTY